MNVTQIDLAFHRGPPPAASGVCKHARHRFSNRKLQFAAHIIKSRGLTQVFLCQITDLGEQSATDNVCGMLDSATGVGAHV